MADRQWTPSRLSGLVSRGVGDEVIVYDRASATVHALDAVAASVLQCCDGTRDVRGIEEALKATMGDEPALRAAECLAQLSDAGLLEPEAPSLGLSRRAVLAGVGVGAAAPLVVSILAPTVAAAQSGGGGGGGPTVPSAPVITYQSRSGGTATVSFVQGSDGGSPITNYEYSINGGPWVALAPADTASPVSVPGVVGGTPIQLRAVNGVGTSPSSNTVTVLVEAYQLEISRNTAMTFTSGGPYPLDVPSFRLDNTSTDPNAKITNFKFTIGTTTKNFDGLIPPSSDGNPKPPYSAVGETNVSPDGNIAGGTRSDLIEWNFTAFDAGDFFIFAVDIDNDPNVNVTTNDFRTIFQNASVITVTYSTGAVLSQTVGAMSGLGPFTYSQTAP